MNYARAIRTMAAARGLTQQELAERLRMDEGQLSRVGRVTPPTMRTLERIARTLEMPLFLLVLLASDVDDLGGPDRGVQLAGLGPQILATVIAFGPAGKPGG